MIKSSYLNKEIDLKTGVATTASGRKNTIVFHHELERFINEALLAEGIDVIYDFMVYNSNPNDVVVKCDMWDRKQKRVVTIGEATPSTLNSSIEKAFPATMASHRAFDRAAIRFLGLGPHVYSDMEMDPDGPVTTTHNNLVDANPAGQSSAGASTAAQAKEASDNAKVTNSTAESEQHQPVKKNSSTEGVKPATAQSSKKAVSAPAPVSNSADDDGAVKVTFGKYTKESKTVAEIFTTDRNWLEYVVNNIHPKNEEYIKQLAAAKRYLEAHS